MAALKSAPAASATAVETVARRDGSVPTDPAIRAGDLHTYVEVLASDKLEGRLTGTRLACPWHGWMFDLRSGECLMPSRGGRVDTYPVTIENGDVWVEIA